MPYTKKERLTIECVCGREHMLSRAAMAAVITAFTRGYLHKRTANGLIEPTCITDTFAIPEVMELYDGRPITWEA
jgi:hypothetical protein